MFSASILNTYAATLALSIIVAAIFYVIEYTSRGRSLRNGLIGSTRAAALFGPLPVAVFLYAQKISWPNQMAWRVYAVLFLVVVVRIAVSRRNRDNRRNFLQTCKAYPVVATIVLLGFMMLLLPAVAILYVYSWE